MMMMIKEKKKHGSVKTFITVCAAPAARAALNAFTKLSASPISKKWHLSYQGKEHFSQGAAPEIAVPTPPSFLFQPSVM